MGLLHGPAEYAAITRVGPRLFLSGAPGREDAERLRALGVTGILSVARECGDEWAAYEPGLHLVHFGFRDHEPLPAALAVATVRTLAALLAEGPTLVHCGIGVSRSPTFVALYLWATRQARSHPEAVARLRRLRPCVAPNAIVDEAVLAAVARLRGEWGRGVNGGRRRARRETA